MPRTATIQKDVHAKALLSQGYTFTQIQKELKIVFGSGISTNRLVSFRKELATERSKPRINNDTTLSHNMNPQSEFSQRSIKDQIPNNIENVNYPSNESQSNGRMIEQIEVYEQMLKNLFSKNFEQLTILHTKIEQTLSQFQANMTPEFTEEDMLNSLYTSRAKVSNFLINYGNPIERTTLATQVDIGPELLNLILLDLYDNQIIDIIEKEGIKYYQMKL